MTKDVGSNASVKRVAGSPFISLIIPVHNEETQISQCLHSAYECFGFISEARKRPSAENQNWALSQVEFIVVDANSSDGTHRSMKALCEEAQDHDLRLFYELAPRGGRANQMNHGASKASGQVLVFLHADTRLQRGFESEIRRFLRSEKPWGFCHIQFDADGWRYRMLRYMINLRSSLFGISTGDQVQFVKVDDFNIIGGFADQPLMEDVEMSKSLKAIEKPFIITCRAITSARKWQTEGFWRTILLMWKLRFSYWRGASAESVHRRYYRSN